MDRIAFSVKTSKAVRTLALRDGQKVTTENGMVGKVLVTFQSGNVKWFRVRFQNHDGKIENVEYRMMCFPYLSPMSLPAHKRDHYGMIDVKVNYLKGLNREIARLLK